MSLDFLSCRLCGSAAALSFSLTVLHRHPVNYFLCPNCELLQTEQPHWLDEAYSAAIGSADTGVVARNVVCCRLTAVVALISGIRSFEPCLDFGGGHGILTRMMRDAGWSFTWSDRFASNDYAVGFEGEPDKCHSLVTAFEVFEHLVNVKTDLAGLFAPAPDLDFISTIVHETPDPDWWYLVPEGGQHVALFGRRTLDHVAAKAGYDLIRASAYHLFVRRGRRLAFWRRWLLKLMLSQIWLSYGLGMLLVEARRPWSLTWSDHVERKGSAKA